MNEDPFNLERFVAAQATAFDTALCELRAGRKHSHWMWFVFPQMRGLGRSSTAEFYGLASLDEAQAYLEHPVLAPRLQQATQAIRDIVGRSPREILGSPDDLKFHSSMTVFAIADPTPDSPFRAALERFFDGVEDEATLRLIRRSSG